MTEANGRRERSRGEAKYVDSVDCPGTVFIGTRRHCFPPLPLNGFPVYCLTYLERLRNRWSMEGIE